MNPLPTPSDAHDLRSDIRRALASANDQGQGGYSGTSDLTMDEELNLHSIGWEPVELVSGLSVFSVATGFWNWGQGEILGASAAHAMAFQHASSRLHSEAAAAGGHGVVGVHIERFVHPTHIEVTLLGTAVRPVGSSAITASEVFISDLSARDFTLLMVAGWQPLGLATGASFVYAPRRSVGTILQQQSQNVELKNFTEAMYSARSTAMQHLAYVA